jgi:hypothetical protein
VVKHFLPYEKELNDSNYHVRTKDDEAINQLRVFWDICIPYLQRKLKFDLILSGNFVYVTQQEMFRSARKCNIPVVVLYKEGMFPLDRKNDVIDVFYTTKYFLADKILFYNEGIRDILLKSNLPGLSVDKTAVVGVPRFDYLIKEKNLHREITKNIVLFAFDPQSKSEYLIEDSSSKKAFERALFDFQLNLVNIAKLRPDFKLIIKSKSDPKSIEFVKNILNKSGCNPMPKNIRTSHNLNVQQLIRVSSIVAGYSSTTLIEALVQKKTVICPDVSQFFKEKAVDLFQGLDLGIKYVVDIEQLNVILEDNRIPFIDEDKSQLGTFLRSMVYRLDGKSSKRVEVEFNKLIN